MNESTLHHATITDPANVRGVTDNKVRMRSVDLGRADRLDTLADRLERTLAHQLIELAPLAWSGDDATAAVEKLRACSLQLAVAANGVRATATRLGLES